MLDYYEIIIEADVVSKKNQYAQTRTGRRFKPQSIVETERLALAQIPADLYQLNLQHPAIEFIAFIPKKSWALDIDGVFTTICDYLVKAKVIKDDCIRHFNGPKLLHPVMESERKKFIIRIYPNGKLPYVSC
jgi:hypothetical protein